MTKVIMKSWREGMKKVSLSKLQVELLQKTYTIAKQNVDKLLDGETIVLEIEEEAVAVEFYESAEKLGVDCLIMDGVLA